MTKNINDIVIHEWKSIMRKDSIRVDKEDLDMDDFEGSEIYKGFGRDLDEPIGNINSARIEDNKLIANLTIEERKLEDDYDTVTLAPAFSGDLVENEDGEIIRLNNTEVDCIGLFYDSNHEVEELTNNLGEKLNEEH